MTGGNFLRGVTVAVCGLLAGVHAGGGESRASPRSLPHLDWRPPSGPGAEIGTPSGLNRVMTDTLDYCVHLAAMYDMVRQSGQAADPEDDVLARDGLAMCRHGDVRTGVHALRRALVGFGPQP